MGFESAEAASRKLKEWEHDLRSYTEFEEVILWFEHDLFDQLGLVHHLAFFAGENVGNTCLSLICIGDYPGIKRFRGLGQLTPQQMVSLLGTRQPIADNLLVTGAAAWEAFGSTEPAPWLKLLARKTHKKRLSGVVK